MFLIISTEFSSDFWNYLHHHQEDEEKDDEGVVVL